MKLGFSIWTLLERCVRDVDRSDVLILEERKGRKGSG